MTKVAESLAAELLAEPHGRVAMKAVHRLLIIIVITILVMKIIDVWMIITLLHRFLAYNAEWCGNQVSPQQN